MSSVENHLRFKVASSRLTGTTPLKHRTRPTVSGLDWLASPSSDVCAGLAFRFNNNAIEALRISVASGVAVSHSILVGSPVVKLASSYDGRLVAACLSDGSLHCFDSTESSLTLRWSLQNAHSHRVRNIQDSVSSSRKNAAGESGPVRSLIFSPTGYALALVDTGNQRLQIFQANQKDPSEFKETQISNLLVSCAVWSPFYNKSDCIVAIGTSTNNGCIYIYKYNLDHFEFTLLSKIEYPGDTNEDNTNAEVEWTCTHLDWTNRGDSLAIGFCRVISTDEDNQEDENEEDDDEIYDSSEHEVQFYIVDLNKETYTVENTADLGEIVPFFGVPKNGRHVFFSSSIPLSHQTSKRITLLLVTTNVGNEVELLGKEESGPWQIMDLPDGNKITMPTDDEDLFFFPAGLTTILVQQSDDNNEFSIPYILLSATDSSLSVLEIIHFEDDNFFRVQLGSRALNFPPKEVQPETKKFSNTELISGTKLKKSSEDFNHAKECTLSDQKKISQQVQMQTFCTLSKSNVFSPVGVNDKFSFNSSSIGLSSSDSARLDTSSLEQTAFKSSSTFGATSKSSSSMGKATFGSTTAIGSATFGSLSNIGQTTFGSLTPGSFSFGKLSTPTISTIVNPNSGKVSHFGSKLDSVTEFSNTHPTDAFGSKTMASRFDTSISSQGLVSSLTISGSGSYAFSSNHRNQLIQQPSTFTSNSHSLHRNNSLSSDESTASGQSASSKTEKDESSSGSCMIQQINSQSTGDAAQAFDSIDKANKHSLPTTAIKELLEAIGEVFNEKEHDLLVALLDPENTGMITRASFTSWYSKLKVDEYYDNGKSEEEEREDERKKALEHFLLLAQSEDEKSHIHVGELPKYFMSLSENEQSRVYISAKDFPKLLESMKTTYCEEVHSKTIKRLADNSGKIYLKHFLNWYVDWLFNGDDSSDDSCSDTNEPSNTGTNFDTNKTQTTLHQQGWEDIFKRKEGSWKCITCMVENDSDKVSCVACDTNKAGLCVSSKSMFTSNASSAMKSMIGSEGFTFGSASQTTTNSGLNFKNFSIGSLSITSNTQTAGGFTFSSVSSKASSNFDTTPLGDTNKSGNIPNSVLKDDGSVKIKEDDHDSIKIQKHSNTQAELSMLGLNSALAIRAFDHFDQSKSGFVPISMLSDLLDGVGEFFEKSELKRQTLLIDPSSSGMVEKSAFVSWYVKHVSVSSITDTGDEGMQGIIRKKAYDCFNALQFSDNDAAFVGVSDFPKFIASVDVSLPMAQIEIVAQKLADGDGKIFLESFLDWYVESKAEESSQLADECDERTLVTTVTQSNNSKLHPQQSQTVLCSKNGIEKMPNISSSDTYVNTALKAFDSFDTEKNGLLKVSLIESLLDEIGEGFQGEELDSQIRLMDPTEKGVIERNSFVNWYRNLVSVGDKGNSNDNGSLESDEKEERKEERDKAEKSFLIFAKVRNGKQYILSEDFPKVIESLNTTYCEEEHKSTLKKLAKNDKIFLNDFLDWYESWLFCGDESTDDDNSSATETHDLVTQQKASVNDGWGSIFAKKEGTWKCSVCMIENDVDKGSCVACETLRPGSNVPTSKPIVTDIYSGFIGTCAPSITSNGFSFVSAPCPATNDQKSTSAFETTVSNSGFGVGGFVFGGSTNLTIGIKEFNVPVLSSVNPTQNKSPRLRSKTVVPSSSQTVEDSTTSCNINPLEPSSATFSFGKQENNPREKNTSGNNVTTEHPFLPTNIETTLCSPRLSESRTPITTKSKTNITSNVSAVTAFPPIATKSPKLFGMHESTENKQATSTEHIHTPSLRIPISSTSISSSFDGKAKSEKDLVSSTKTSITTNYNDTCKNSTSSPLMSSKSDTPLSTQSKNISSSTQRASASFPPLASKSPTPFSTQTSTKNDGIKSSSSSFTPSFGNLTSSKMSFSDQPKPQEASSESTQSNVTTNIFTRPTESNSSSFVSSVNSTPSTAQSKAKEKSTLTAGAAFPPLASKSPTPFNKQDFASLTKSTPTAFPKAISGASFPPLSFSSPTPFSIQGSSFTDSQARTLSLDRTAGKALSLVTNGNATPSSSQDVTEVENRKASGSSVVHAFDSLGMSSTNPFTLRTQKQSKDVPLMHTTSDVTSFTSTDTARASVPMATLSNSTKSQSSTTTSEVMNNYTSYGTTTANSKCNLEHAPTRSLRKTSTTEFSECTKEFVQFVNKLNRTQADLAARQPKDDDFQLKEDIKSISNSINHIWVHISKICANTDDCKFRSVHAWGRKLECSRIVEASNRLILRLMANEDDKLEDVITKLPLDKQTECQLLKLAEFTFLASQLYNIASSRLDLIVNLDTPEAELHLLRVISETYKRVKSLSQYNGRIKNRLSEVGISISGQIPSELINSSTLTLSSKNSKQEQSGYTKFVTETSKNRLVQKWNAIGNNFESLNCTSRKILDVCHKMSSFDSVVISPSTNSLDDTSIRPKPERRLQTKFAVPLPTKPRAGWDEVSVIDQEKAKQISFTIPRDVKLASFDVVPSNIRSESNVNPGIIGKTTSSSATEFSSQNAIGTNAQRPSVEGHHHQKGRAMNTKKQQLNVPLPDQVSSSQFENIDHTQSSSSWTNSTSVIKRTALDGTEIGRKPLTTVSAIDSMSLLRNSLISDPNSTTTDEGGSDLVTEDDSELEDPKKVPNYVDLLTRFYECHNPSKISEVKNHLAKYQGREEEMFAKLAQKYKVQNPLHVLSQTDSLEKNDVKYSSMDGFSKFHASTSPILTEPYSRQHDSTLPKTSPSKSPFAFGQSTQQVTAPTTFGAASSGATTSFSGSNVISSSPFGNHIASTTITSFSQSSQQMAMDLPFGSSQLSPPPVSPGPNSSSFSGNSARDLLYNFYQNYNPSKIAEVDKLLVKYQGNEEQLFRNLAKKYNLDPSVFGLSNTTPASSGTSGMGSSFGIGFGQPSILGGGPTFGSVGTPAQASFGVGAGSQATPFGSPALRTQGIGFGVLAQSPPSSGFGSLNSTGALMSSVPQFSSSTPFGAPRR